MLVIHYISLKKIKNSFPMVIYERGINYYRNSNVVKFSVNNNRLSAKVRGNYYSSYNVRIKLNDYGFTGHCNCPYEDYCKHMVAVLLKYYYEYQKDERKTLTSELTEPIPQWVKKLQKIDLKKTKITDNDQLLTFIDKSSRNYPEMALTTIVYLINDDKKLATFLKIYQERIDETFTDIEKTTNDDYDNNENDEDDYYDDYYDHYDDHYDDYYDEEEDQLNIIASNEVKKTIDTFTKEISLFTTEVALKITIELLKRLLQHLHYYDHQEYQISLSKMITRLLKYYQEPSINIEKKKNVLLEIGKMLVDNYNLPPALIIEISETLVNITTTEEEYPIIQENIITLTKKSLALKKGLQRPLARLALKKNDIETYVRLQKNNLITEKDYLKLADFLDKNNIPLEKEKILLQGLKELTTNDTNKIFNRLKDYYRETNNNDKLTTIIIDRIIRNDHFDDQLIKELQQITKNEALWSKYQQKIIDGLTRKENYPAIINLYYSQKKYKKILDMINNKKIPPEEQQKAAIIIKNIYPKKILKYFKKRVKSKTSQITKGARFNKRYWSEMEKDIQEIKDIYLNILKRPTDYQQYKEKLLIKYPTRKKLQRML